MSVFMMVASFLTFVIGLGVFIASSSAFQEQVGATFLLISTIFFAGSSIVSAVDRLGQTLMRALAKDS